MNATLKKIQQIKIMKINVHRRKIRLKKLRRNSPTGIIMNSSIAGKVNTHLSNTMKQSVQLKREFRKSKDTEMLNRYNTYAKDNVFRISEAMRQLRHANELNDFKAIQDIYCTIHDIRHKFDTNLFVFKEKANTIYNGILAHLNAVLLLLKPWKPT